MAARTALAVIVPLALVTLGAVIWMWPGGSGDAPGGSGPGLTKVSGTITGIDLKPCPGPVGGTGVPRDEPEGNEPDAAPPPIGGGRCGDVRVRLTSGAEAGRIVGTALPGGPGTQGFRVGDDVILIQVPDSPDGHPYQLSDHDRSGPLWLVGMAFALAVIAFGRWRGVTALVGLAVTFTLLLMFLIPAILEGRPPLLVAIVCAAAIMLTVLYLTHGFTLPTSIAVVGTLASLSLTGLLALAAIELTHLSGITDDHSLNLSLGHQTNAQGLLLASIIIGSLGVLDDVTITQSATVGELARADPSYDFRRLYGAASRVGRAHIASVINTIILAYAGASLPLLLLFNVGRQPIGEIVASPIVAQEIVRSVAGTLGLIAAVPITTALAALAQVRTRTAAPSPEPPAEHERPSVPAADLPASGSHSTHAEPEPPPDRPRVSPDA